NGVFVDDEFVKQASMVLEERLALLDYAVDNYDDGLLFFYFSSSDLQSHMFWWDSDQEHPVRSDAEAKKYFGHIRRLYQQLDGVVEPGEQRDAILTELADRLQAVTDFNGQPIIRGVYRSDQIYSGGATGLAPDLIVGYRRGYRASWATCLGELTDEILLDND